MNKHDKFLDIVDFVEDHGGALGGEQVAVLFLLCQSLTDRDSDEANAKYRRGET